MIILQTIEIMDHGLQIMQDWIFYVKVVRMDEIQVVVPVNLSSLSLFILIFFCIVNNSLSYKFNINKHIFSKSHIKYILTIRRK